MRRSSHDPEELEADLLRPAAFKPALRTALRENMSVLQVGTRLVARRRPEATTVDPDRVPVLLIPGFLSGDFAMRPMADALRARGHRTSASGIAPNVGCTEELAAAVERRVEQVHERTGVRVAIVGWSRGGTLGSLVARRRPELVAALVTLGTPHLDLLAINATLTRQLQILTRLRSLGVAGVLGEDCVSGQCGQQVRQQLATDFPAQVPYLSLFSTSDGVVDWRACLDPAAEEIEVTATHMGMAADEEVITLVAERLGTMVPAAARTPRRRSRRGAPAR